MNDGNHNHNNVFVGWCNRLGHKINRTFIKIGYRRAANELARLGYLNVSKTLTQELEKLEKSH